jgi:hypothetical protein
MEPVCNPELLRAATLPPLGLTLLPRTRASRGGPPKRSASAPELCMARAL